MTLLLRLAAPLQSWGIAHNFNQRDTAREPTKSGVIGMIAAALGRRRTESLDDLNTLRFGVRLDQPGTLLRDYHMVRGVERTNIHITNRYYLADAVFLVGLQGDPALLESIAIALCNPVFPLFLGRRSCPPVGPLVLGTRPLDLEDTLHDEPWQAAEWVQRKSAQPALGIVCEVPAGQEGSFLRRDVPVSFSPALRRHAVRSVVDKPAHVKPPKKHVAATTEHDAMASLT